LRNPARIEVVSVVLRTLWAQTPDLRMGQLLLNLAGSDDLYNMEDDELLERAKKVLKEGWGSL
jgi:uncharacterized protein YihD (DUF1040 family)